MSTKTFGAALASLTLALGAAAWSGGAAAGPLASNGGESVGKAASQNAAQPVRHRRWGGGGVGIYIGPGYDYYDRYGYYPSYGYYNDRYYGHHRHSRRWVRNRFQHPLGRR